MDNGSKRKHRSRKKRINVATVSKAPDEEDAASSKASKSADKEKKNEGGTAEVKEKESEQSQSTETSPRPSGASSPEPNCAICLGKLENKSFTDSCFHTFCFVCLVEWSKVKAECPLCKQAFKSIVHNVRSYEDYDQYHVQNPETQNAYGNHIRHLMEGVRFRYRTTVTDHRYAHIAERIDQEIQNRLLQRPSSRVPVPNWRRMRQPANSDFRRSIYLQRLKQRTEHMTTRRRVRETSPSFYRENPAQTHRLVPWLNRELNALLHGHGEQMAFVLDLIMGLVKRYAIDSEEFYQHVYPFIGRHTRQFMREFLLFARSPYHMAAYDRHVTYEASDEPHHDSESDSDHNAPETIDDGNDSDVVVVDSPDSPTESGHNPAAAPSRPESGLDPWERSIMTMGNPSYLGFQPIVRSFGHENLSQGNPYNRVDLPPSASGWDSPTPGPSNIFDDLGPIPSSSFMGVGINPLVPSSISIWTPSASSYSAPITPLQTRTDSSDNFQDTLNLLPTIQATGTHILSSNTQADPILCHESDSDSDEVMIVDYEKPWNERSPIQLSSAASENDSDIVITGMTYTESPVKKEKKRKHKRKRKDQKEKDSVGSQDCLRIRLSTATAETTKPKKRRLESKSKSRSLPRADRADRSRSRSSSPSSHSQHFRTTLRRSRSPIKIKLSKRPSYKHKKFGYSTHTSSERDEDSFRSRSITGRRHSNRDRSSSATCTDSDREIRHVTYTSHKHLDRKRASIEMLEYRKKSSKHKKKHKKHKKNSRSKEHLKQSYGDGSLGERDQFDSEFTYKHSKSKKIKSKHKSQKHKENSPRVSEHCENKSEDMSSKEPADVDSDGELSAHVSESVARIFKEIAEMKQQKAQETRPYTSDSDRDSEEDTEVETGQSGNKNQMDGKQDTISNTDVNDKVELETENVESEDVAKPLEISETGSIVEESKLSENLFQGNGLEFVELSQDQAADMDLELASIAKDLDNSNDEANRPKQFKKHPFGHKKSGKQPGCIATTVHDRTMDLSVATALQAPLPQKTVVNEDVDNIQSNDVSSCTDLEYIQTGRTGVNNINILASNQQDASIIGTDCEHVVKKHTALSGLDKELLSYELPSSSAVASLSTHRIRSTDFVNVETLSDSSDVDIVGEHLPDNFMAISSFKANSTSLKITDSNVESVEEVVSSEPLNSRNTNGETHEEIDVTGFSETDSVVECVGEEHRKITIETDTDDSDSYIEVLHNDSDHYVDVLGYSEEEIVIGEEEMKENKKSRRTKFTINSESDSTDLDYHCDNDEEETENKQDENEECSDILGIGEESNHLGPDDVRTNEDMIQPVDDCQSVYERATGREADACYLQDDASVNASCKDDRSKTIVHLSSGCNTQCISGSQLKTTSVSTATDKSCDKADVHIQGSSRDAETSDFFSHTLFGTKSLASRERTVNETDANDPNDSVSSIEHSTSNRTEEENKKTEAHTITAELSSFATQGTSREPGTLNAPHMTWSSLFTSGGNSSSTNVRRQFTPTEFDRRSPFFQPSPEYEQFWQRSPADNNSMFDGNSLEMPDLSDENFVPED